MKHFVAVLICVLLAWVGYDHYATRAKTPVVDESPRAVRLAAPAPAAAPRTATSSAFSCDGRTHCSHMRSCAEATFFLQNCPGTEMDGDNDGVPCERQWCNR